MRQVLSVDSNEPCYWIREEVVDSPDLGLAVRVQHVVVERDGDLAMYSQPVTDGFTKGPPIEFDSGQMSVAKARDIIEGIRNRKRNDPPPITVNLNGETYIESDHPALEGVPVGNSNPDTRN